jgi:hypothetical protein
MRYPLIAPLQCHIMGSGCRSIANFKGSPDGYPLTIWKKQAMIGFNQSRALRVLTKDKSVCFSGNTSRHYA